MTQRTPRRTVVAIATMVLAPYATALEPTAQVVEFYNPALNHYFITAFPEEAAMLDAGTTVKGWTRTGVTFNAWQSPGDDPLAVAVCRFFGTPSVGPDSHFYTADAAECATVKANPNWTYEAIAFHIRLPQSGSCPDRYGSRVPQLLPRRVGQPIQSPLPARPDDAPEDGGKLDRSRVWSCARRCRRRRSRPTSCACSSNRRSGPTMHG